MEFISIAVGFILFFSASTFGTLFYICVHFDLSSRCEDLEVTKNALQSRIELEEKILKDLKDNVFYYKNRLSELVFEYEKKEKL